MCFCLYSVTVYKGAKLQKSDFELFLPQKKAKNQKNTINVAGLVRLELSHMVQKMLGMQQKVIFMVVRRGRVNNVLYPK